MQKVEYAFMLVDLLTRDGQYERALNYLATAEQAVNQQMDNEARIQWHRKKGVIAFHQGNHGLALKEFKSALKLAEKEENELVEAISLNDVGTVYKSMGEYRFSLEYLNKSLLIKEKVSSDKAVAVTLHNIASLYELMDDQDSALRFYQRAERLYQSLTPEDVGDKLAHLYENLGLLKGKLDQFEESIEHFNASIQSYEKLDQDRDLIRVRISLSNMLNQIGEHSEALKLLQWAEDQEQIHAQEPSLALRLGLAETFLELGQAPEAIPYANQALQLANKQQNLEKQTQAYYLFYQIQLSLGDKISALNYLQSYIEYRKELTQKKLDKQLLSLQSEIRFQESERQLSLLTKDNEIKELQISQQKWLLLGISVIGGLIGFILFRFFRSKRIENRRLKREIKHHERKYQMLGESKNQLVKMLSHISEPIMCVDVAGFIMFANTSFNALVKSSNAAGELNNLKDTFPKLAEHLSSLKMEEEDEASSYLIGEYVVENVDAPLEVKVMVHTLNLADQYLVIQFSPQQDTKTTKATEVATTLTQLNQFRALSASVSEMSSDLSKLDLEQSEQMVLKLKSIEENLGQLIDPSAKQLQQDQSRYELVGLMNFCVETWELNTQTDKISLAEASRIWRVSIDNGSLRTRSMDRYLNIHTLPKKPRWRQVIRTAHYILAQCQLDEKQRKALTQQLDKTTELIRLAA